MRIDGNALLSAVRYELEKLCCSACGEVTGDTLERRGMFTTGLVVQVERVLPASLLDYQKIYG
jgi:hypothetical protein